MHEQLYRLLAQLRLQGMAQCLERILAQADTEALRTSAAAAVVVVLVVAMGHLILFPRVADLDGFYHVGHAFAYAAGSIFDTSFPWATESVIGDLGADLWWGFHVLLLPVTFLGSVEAAIRLASVMLSLVLTAAFFLALRRHAVPGAAWWTALFLIAVPNVFFRHLMVRPHVVSLGASVLLLSFLARGRWWQVTLLAAFITWTHLSLFWMGIGIAAAYALVRVVDGLATPATAPHSGVPARAALPAVMLGTLAGWLFRPQPLEAAALANVSLASYPNANQIIDALTRAHGRKSEAAKALGISRTTLWRRIKELGLG